MEDGRIQVRHEGDTYRRIEVITGSQRRRRWSAAEKAKIIAESALPGANVSEVARRFGVNRGLLTAWRRQAGVVAVAAEAALSPVFVPVEIEAPSAISRGDAHRLLGDGSAPGSGERIEVELRGGRIVLCGRIDPGLAVAVIAAVRGRP